MTKGLNYDFDTERYSRIGIKEAIFCEPKLPVQISQLVSHLHESGENVLLTRLSQDQFNQLSPQIQELLTYFPIGQIAYLGNAQPISQNRGSVAIVSGGTSDQRIVEEVRQTLAFDGISSECFQDVGVAGLHRLLSHLEEIRSYDIIVAIAGMEASLPTVLGGLVGVPIIAVPTSNGYGVAKGGNVACNALLSSCTPGLMVVNVDNGYGAAAACMRILNSR